MAKKHRAVDMAQASPAEAPAKELVDFEAWYSERGHMIPAHHYKEILKADFAAQGVAQGSMEDFDKALEKYGVMLG